MMSTSTNRTHLMLLQELKRKKSIPVFTNTFLKGFKAMNDPHVDIVTYKKPVKITQYVTPVIAMVNYKESP